MIKAKIDILQALKEKGYNTTYLRKNNLIGESTLTKIRKGDLTGISLKTINIICRLLKKQPGQIIEYEPDTTDEIKNE